MKARRETQSARIIAAFEQGRSDARRRIGTVARYADLERDAAYLRGYHLEAAKRQLYQRTVKRGKV